MSNIAAIDVETTGLIAHKEHLLEIACIPVDENLNVLDTIGFHAVVRYRNSERHSLRDRADPYVRRMHDITGLWGKLRDGVPLEDIDAQMRDYLKQFGEPGTMPVLGNSVRLDMNFMDEYLPLTAAFLDYHMRDVSTVAGLASDWYDLPYFEKHSDHTAMTDIKESIRELKHYREAIFRTGNELMIHEKGAAFHARAIRAERELDEFKLSVSQIASSAAVSETDIAQVAKIGQQLGMFKPDVKTGPSEEFKEIGMVNPYVKTEPSEKPS